MKIIKSKIILFLTSCFGLFILLTAQPAMAQDAAQSLKDKTPEQRAQLQTNMMKTKLNLDSAQTLKVQHINLKCAQKMDPILKGDGGRFSKFSQLKSIQGDKNKELKAVFSADQYKQYEQMEAEMKGKMKDYVKSKKQ